MMDVHMSLGALSPSLAKLEIEMVFWTISPTPQWSGIRIPRNLNRKLLARAKGGRKYTNQLGCAHNIP